MAMSGKHHALAVLCPGERTPWYPLYKRLGGPQSRGGLSYGKDYLKDKCEYQYDEYHGSSWYSSEAVLD